MVSFSLLLLSHSVGLLSAAQSSSHFHRTDLLLVAVYSMDVGETKGEHGGLHEAMIGAGMCLGPAVGALSLYLVLVFRTPVPILSPHCWPVDWLA